MKALLRIVERRTRYLLGFSASLIVAIMLAFNTGLECGTDQPGCQLQLAIVVSGGRL